jgi:hypothetical protein
MKPKKYSLKSGHKTKPFIFFNSHKPERDEIEDIKIILGSTFDVVENTHRDPHFNYNQLLHYIIRLKTKSRFLCQGIGTAYIEEAFGKADAAIILGDSTILPNGNIFGFALINFNDDNSIYISIFCSHTGIYGAGEILMKEIEKMCQTLFMTEIHLESVESAITFYEKYGFVKHDESCVGMCEMTKIVKQRTAKKTKKRSPRSPSRSPHSPSRSPHSPSRSPRSPKSTRKK